MDNNDKIVARAKKRFDKLSESQTKAREVGEECMEFVGGEQWSEKDIKSRELSNRPMITINKLAPFVNIVNNKQAMERARIKVSAFEDSDVDTARVINGLLRHIQASEKSEANAAYSTAFFDLVVSGFGYWRVDTVWCDEKSFDQDIIVSAIDDNFSVYLDPDNNFAFITDTMSKEEFEEKYPDATIADWGAGDKIKNVDKNDVTVIEYWEKIEKDIKICKIRVEEEIVLPMDQAQSLEQAIQATMQPPQIQLSIITVTEDELVNYENYEILKERKSKAISVKQYIIAGNEILEENDWAGKYIPIIGVYGQKYVIDGQEFYKGLVYDALDLQKIYNYYRSQEAEMLGKATKAPFIGMEGQFTGHEEEWSRANIDEVPYLEYNNITINGQLAPAPQATMPPQASSGYANAIAQSSDEIKSTIGMFDASLGAQGPEISGKAIIARKEQGDVSTYHFSTAFNKGLRQTGIIIVDLIPKIYDTERTIRILGEDMTDEVVKINQKYINKKGEAVLYDLTCGQYDVQIDTGAPTTTRRMEAANDLLEFAKTIPNSGAVIGDLIAKNMDFDGSEEVASRLNAAIDPALLARAKALQSEGQGGPNADQVQIQKMGQQLQGMQKQLMQMGQLSKENMSLKNKLATNNGQVKIQQEQIKQRASIQAEQIKAQSNIAQAQIRSQSKQQYPNFPQR